MALLKRRHPRTIVQKLRQAVWPSQGWRRTYHYYHHRILRRGDSSYKIAAGLALGAAISWTPFLGFHILLALGLAFCIRASMLAALAGTTWGNPWTLPVMYMITYRLGVSLCAVFGFPVMPAQYDWAYFTGHGMEVLLYLMRNPLELLVPLTLGGIVCAMLFWPLAYIILYIPVDLARRRYDAQTRKKTCGTDKDSKEKRGDS